MSNLLLIPILLGVNIVLVAFLVWQTIQSRLHPPAPPITAQTLSQLMEGILQKYVNQNLGEGSSFFTGKLEKDYQDTLKESLSTVQKEEETLGTEVQNQFKEVEETFKNHLQNIEKSTQEQSQQITQKTAASLAVFEKYLQSLSAASQKSQFESMEVAKQKVDKLFEDFEIKLADFLLQSEQKMMLAVDLELRSARQLIDTYKVQQMNVIDENIMAMLEKTLSLVLAKNLNLKDQMELVYESLEKAKAEKFVV